MTNMRPHSAGASTFNMFRFSGPCDCGVLYWKVRLHPSKSADRCAGNHGSQVEGKRTKNASRR